MRLGIVPLLTLVLCVTATNHASDQLVRFNNPDTATHKEFFLRYGGSYELISAEGSLYRWNTTRRMNEVWDANVAYISPNRKISLFQNPSLEKNRTRILNEIHDRGINLTDGLAYPDNPNFVKPSVQAAGEDTLLKQSWGMAAIDAFGAWKKSPLGKGVVVAVTDTGVDYTHPDLVNNIWINKGEIPDNGIDDDKNGFIDDVSGWDFVKNDNKPYDLSTDLADILFNGGNPGHGTHVAGVVGAVLNNSQGVAGVAPQVKIMPIRFLSEYGKGSSAEGVKVIDYAIANGANIISASWGGEAGEEDDKPLQEAIQRAEKKGILFIAAAGNGRLVGGTSQGFNNDTDSKPILPASFPEENIIAVAALDSQNKLASFSNFGKKTVDLGAPGVKILSTVPGNRYQDTIIDMGSMLKVTWDGTSMATPYVSGAAALLWSMEPTLTADQLKQRLLALTEGTSSVSDKVLTGGRLDLHRVAE